MGCAVCDLCSVRMSWKSSGLMIALALAFSVQPGWSGPLDEFLRNPPDIKRPTWSVEYPPAQQIPKYLAILQSRESDLRQRGVAVGNLAWLALNLTEEPKTRAAGEELLRNHVVPNLALAKVLEDNNVCGWRHSLLAIRRCFNHLEDFEASEECLYVLHRYSDWPGDQEMAFYLHAYQLASRKRYKEAIEALERLPPESNWANQNPALIKIWGKKQAALENQIKQQAVKNRLKASKSSSAR